MTNLSNFNLVTGIHGNEPLPVLALASRQINQVVANPEALARGVRFQEKDMNASFGTKEQTLESKRAELLLKELNTKPVIDFHTFSCISEPFSIVVDQKMLELARLLGIGKVVYMKHNIKHGHALINYKRGVSVEVGHHLDSLSFDRTLQVVESLEKNRVDQIDVYEVYGIIEKKGDYQNFNLHRDGFYPVLAGETAYKHYGLKARKIE